MTAARGATHPDPGRLGAVIFDLDGVITDTARVHAAAWKSLFDGFLRDRASRGGDPFVAFDAAGDYRRWVDGKPRFDGVRSFLGSRGIRVEEGAPDDPPGSETVCGLGNRKDRLFVAVLRRDGVEVFPSTVALAEALRSEGVAVAVVSSSKNCGLVLERAGLGGLFGLRVDGLRAAELGLHGKPAPDVFLYCAELLGLRPQRCAVIEDAVSGVQAGRAGGFGLVVGVDRVGQAEALIAHGAHVAVPDLAGVSPSDLRRWMNGVGPHAC